MKLAVKYVGYNAAGASVRTRITSKPIGSPLNDTSWIEGFAEAYPEIKWIEYKIVFVREDFDE